MDNERQRLHCHYLFPYIPLLDCKQAFCCLHVFMLTHIYVVAMPSVVSFEQAMSLIRLHLPHRSHLRNPPAPNKENAFQYGCC